MNGLLGWLLGIGFLIFAILSGLLAQAEGIYTGLSAVFFLLASLLALPPTGKRFYRLVFRQAPTGSHLLFILLILVGIALLLAGLSLKQTFPAAP